MEEKKRMEFLRKQIIINKNVISKIDRNDPYRDIKIKVMKKRVSDINQELDILTPKTGLRGWL